MKVTELRIGNYIKDGFGDTKQVTMTFHTEIGVEAFKSFNDPIVMFNEDIANPIPLTEEWLLKFGFEKHDNGEDFDEWSLGHVEFTDFTDNTYEYNPTVLSFKHVHQLQNLYFALTGEELTVK